MKLGKQAKTYLANLLLSLLDLSKELKEITIEKIEVDERYKKLYKQYDQEKETTDTNEQDDTYDKYTDFLYDEINNILLYEQYYKYIDETEEAMAIFKKCQDIIKNFLECIEKKDRNLLQISIDDIEKIRPEIKESEIDIFLDLPTITFKTILSFDDAVKLNGLITNLITIGKKLESEYEKENQIIKESPVIISIISMLENNEIILKKEKESCDLDCPVDIKMMDVYKQSLKIINIYKDFIKGEKDLQLIKFSLVLLTALSDSLKEILGDNDKEIKLVGLINYLINIGNKLKHLYKNIDKEDFFIYTDEILDYLQEDQQNIELEISLYSGENKNDEIALEALELSGEVVENYIEIIEENNINIIESTFDTLKEAYLLVESYQNIQRKSREMGLASYLIKIGKNLKTLCTSSLQKDTLEKELEIIHKILFREQEKIEERREKYLSRDIEQEEDVSDIDSFLDPMETNMGEIYYLAMDIIDNYINFIEEDRNLDLINDSFKLATHIACLSEETEQMVNYLKIALPNIENIPDDIDDNPDDIEKKPDSEE
ncbi:MAG TPA: hypothetical protein PL110_10540 [Candidatus Eremiobacteraeota bacterium]|nr:MAG: hypothetical protein BWY64_02692 [bacterium ADurb.Bin363]HPZ08541.1 hypothetical protein [Candidatus Eremiobacteraeota bacterium]